MDRRKKLATAGAISLTATAAVVALASSVGLFGLTDDGPRVGKLSPIDSTQSTTSTTPDGVQTIIVDDTSLSTPQNTAPDGQNGSGHNGDGQNGDGQLSTPSTTTNTLPEADDDHGGDDHDNSGPGSSHSEDDDDNSGPGSSNSGRDHEEDD
jgi:hypothetical protein